jgi:O-antigen/teichoic acid export membrane protein
MSEKSEKRTLAVNSIAMLANRLTQGIATFILTAAIARTLGADALGQYLLAISYYYIFVNLASQGFKTLFTRELTRNLDPTSVYLVSGTLLQLVFGFFSYIAMIILVFLLPYSDRTSFICYLMGAAIIPFALSNITEAIFQAQEKMYLIAISTVPIYVLRLLVIIYAIQLNYGLAYAIGILVISEIVILVIQWLILLGTVKIKWQIDLDFIWQTISTARTFFAIEGIGIIASRIDILILSLLGNEALVGIFGAISQLLQPYFIVSNSIALAAFPSMSKAVSIGKEKQLQIAENTIELLLCISLPFLVGILFVGDRLLLSIYAHPNFAQEAIVLNIISTSLIAFSRVFSYLLIANGLEKLNLIEVVITTVVGSLTGIILISQYQLIGAALMSLGTSFSNFAVLMYFVYSRMFHLPLWKIMRRPLLISLLMSIVFIVLNEFHLDFVLTIVLATCAYIGFAGLLVFRKSGGISL